VLPVEYLSRGGEYSSSKLLLTQIRYSFGRFDRVVGYTSATRVSLAEFADIKPDIIVLPCLRNYINFIVVSNAYVLRALG